MIAIDFYKGTFMTQMPPPPSMPYQPGMNAPMNQPAKTNVAAIISLICGILGCLLITPIVAIVSGIIGIVQAKTLKTGKGMSIAGIILGLLWIVGGLGFFAVIGYGVKHGGGLLNVALQAGTKPALIQDLNSLADGDTATAGRMMPGASSTELDELAAQLKPLGHVKDLDFKSWTSDFTSQKGQQTYTFTADVTFDNGAKTIDGVASSGQAQTNGIGIDKIEIK